MSETRNTNWFKPGQSGNPGGRPKGIVNYVREKTKDGKELVDIMNRIANGEEVFGEKPKLKEIMEAIEWLADRGFGKAIQSIDAIVENTISEAEELSPEERRARIDALIAKRGA